MFENATAVIASAHQFVADHTALSLLATYAFGKGVSTKFLRASSNELRRLAITVMRDWRRVRREIKSPAGELESG